ncbi:MAG: PLP-dependent aminotransferase family protein [Opitutales bacterium]|jgi:2-aminoadipate transaminase|nr:PLP-dependent aminotransferase family protein [Opitutales bacterium]MDP4643072.1 PLP-dependent aminotransferase family protein [Opitutales bacterium]MDP4694488.1 PLP-dependent aminotransferase family protein [Opitutales bacterium]MDP4776782.1 PLP-dependent aminotransferase family protein [Opitutales bacterium]MDP4882871.1 PLP-dependent aminotransferase family protein [Opitutales bacterium]
MSSSDPQPPIAFSKIGREIQSPVIVDLMARALANPELLSLAAGFTDNAVLPRELVARFASELTQAGLADEPLQYGQNQGRARLRELSCEVIASHPGEQAVAFDPSNMFITNGSQQALYLAVQALCDPGDIVLVEEPSYFVCLEMLKGLGLRPIGIPCDDAGAIIPEAMAALLRDLDAAGERARVKAVYLVSYFCNPSSRSLEADEKRAVAKVLLDAGYIVPVMEDAAYRELFFEEAHPAASIISMLEFAPFPKLYLGTYTKPFATGLKVGYGYCTHSEWLGKILGIKGHQDFGSAHFNQALIERVLEEGLYEGHLAGIRKHYARKAQVLEGELLAGGLKELGWRWETPKGGLIIWARAPIGSDLRMESEFCQRCIEQGVLYVPGDLCFSSGEPWHCARLASGALPEDRLIEAAQRFVAVAKQM